MIDIHERLEELRELGLYRRHAHGQRPAGPARRARRQAGAAAVLEQLPRARRPPARARGRGRRGDALGRRRRRVAAGLGDDARSTASSRSRLAEFKHAGSALLFGSGYLANVGVVSALAGSGEVVFSDELNHASIIDGCRLSRAETFVYRHNDIEHLAWALERAVRPRRADRHRLGLLDGRRRRAAGRARRARAAPPRAARRRRGARRRLPRPRRAAARSTRPGSSTRSTSSSARSARRSAATAPTSTCDGELARYLVNRSRPFIFSTAPPPPAVAAALAALELLAEEPRRVERLAQNGAALRDELAREGFDVVGLDDADRPARDRRRRRRRCGSASWRSSAASSRRRSARRRCPRARRACAWR